MRALRVLCCDPMLHAANIGDSGREGGPLASLRALLDANGLARVALHVGDPGPCPAGGVLAPRAWPYQARTLPAGPLVGDGWIVLAAHPVRAHLRPTERAWAVTLVRADGTGGAVWAAAVVLQGSLTGGVRVARSVSDARRRPSASTGPIWHPVPLPIASQAMFREVPTSTNDRPDPTAQALRSPALSSSAAR